MSTFLFLDDERFIGDVTWVELPRGNWDIVRTQDEFEAYILKNGIPDHISFDNDLGEDAETKVRMGEGIQCAHWLVEKVLDEVIAWNPNFKFTVHSKNNIAAKAIEGLLTPFIRYMNEQ